jgi:transketolase
VTLTFVNQVLPRLLAQGRDPQVYYVSSAELFDLLPKKERERVYPADMAQLAMGITGFTLPTLYRWVTSALGRGSSLHPFVTGRYPGSGRGEQVLAQAGLDAEGQLRAIHDYRSALGQ